jgi:hypothetical protein
MTFVTLKLKKIKYFSPEYEKFFNWKLFLLNCFNSIRHSLFQSKYESF